jgi:hypothetical protein
MSTTAIQSFNNANLSLVKVGNKYTIKYSGNPFVLEAGPASKKVQQGFYAYKLKEKKRWDSVNHRCTEDVTGEHQLAVKVKCDYKNPTVDEDLFETVLQQIQEFVRIALIKNKDLTDTNQSSKQLSPLLQYPKALNFDTSKPVKSKDGEFVYKGGMSPILYLNCLYSATPSKFIEQKHTIFKVVGGRGNGEKVEFLTENEVDKNVHFQGAYFIEFGDVYKYNSTWYIKAKLLIAIVTTIELNDIKLGDLGADYVI